MGSRRELVNDAVPIARQGVRRVKYLGTTCFFLMMKSQKIRAILTDGAST
jgi:hypothetical protein